MVYGIGVIDVRRCLLTARGDKCVFECKQGDIKMHSPMDIVARNAAKNNRHIYDYISVCVCVSIHIQTGLRSSVFCSISWQLSILNAVLSLRARERDRARERSDWGSICVGV